MDRTEFNTLFDQTVERLRHLNATKGVEYSGHEDVLSDFKEVAEQMGITPRQALMVYATKHWRAINSYVREGKVLSEAIEGRIDDLILYSVLLQALIAEEKGARPQRVDRAVPEPVSAHLTPTADRAWAGRLSSEEMRQQAENEEAQQ